MSAITTVCKRELRSYFATPVAYVFIVIFLVLSSAFTFYLGNFYERGQADLLPFFSFLPWLYLFLVPAVSMRLWSEERKSGTIELLLTLPILLPMWKAVGLDLIWMGVLVVMLLEIGLMTPPVGLNAFVVKSVVGDQVSLSTIFRGLWWFIAVDVVVVALLVAFPQISLYLPGLLE